MIDRQNQSGKVTLEDLLRLKRAERPRAEFWADFDRTLHAKQLAAIVEKRPWWRQASWLRASRWSLPLSAAAALAVTFATVGHPTIAKNKAPRATAGTAVKTAAGPAVTAPSATAASSAASAENVAARVAPATALADEPMTLASLERKELTPTFTAVAAVAAATAPIATSVAPRRPASSSFSMTEQIAGLAVSSESDSASAHFATVAGKDSLSTSQLNGFLDKNTLARFDTTSVRPAHAVEPLSQMQTPREARRARLVALLSLPGYDDASDSSSTASRSRERSLSHFNDQAMYDAISRLEMRSSHREAAIQF